MGVLKLVWMWLEQVIKLPGNLSKVASINRYLENEKQLAEAKDTLKQVQDCLAAERAIKSGRMTISDNAAWAKGENGEVERAPYCARCLELDGKAVHLLVFTRYDGYGQAYAAASCPECKGRDFPIRSPQ